jgi:hypothetical protein
MDTIRCRADCRGIRGWHGAPERLRSGAKPPTGRFRLRAVQGPGWQRAQLDAHWNATHRRPTPVRPCRARLEPNSGRAGERDGALGRSLRGAFDGDEVEAGTSSRSQVGSSGRNAHRGHTAAVDAVDADRVRRRTAGAGGGFSFPRRADRAAAGARRPHGAVGGQLCVGATFAQANSTTSDLAVTGCLRGSAGRSLRAGRP